MWRRWGISVAAALLLAGCAPAPGGPTPNPEQSSPAPSPSATTAPSEPAPTEPEPVLPAPPLGVEELNLYGGVARLDTSSSCTGTLIETGVDEGPAYILTNGHCVGLDNGAAGDVLVDGEGSGEAHFFHVPGAAESSVKTVPVARYEYGTMRGVDIGVIRLDATLGELRAAGAVPLPITDEAPAAGTQVVNIAAPTQGVEPSEVGLRKGECTLGEPADLIEHIWLWLGAPRNDCPGVLGGSSGSPLIADGKIVSIVNTTNTGVPADRAGTCYLGKPCELEGDGAVAVPDSSYGVDIAGLGACFVEGSFKLGGDCPLPASSLTGVRGGGIYGTDGLDGADLEPWLNIDGDTPTTVAVARVPLGEARSCTDAATYAGAPQVEVGVDGVALPVDLPTEHGFALVCVAEPGKEADAVPLVFSIDGEAPTTGPKLAVQELEDGVRMIDPLFEIPDIADIHVNFGPAAATDCSDRDAYLPYRRQSFFIEPTELPLRFCAIGFDMAGNESPITEELFEEA